MNAKILFSVILSSIIGLQSMANEDNWGIKKSNNGEFIAYTARDHRLQSGKTIVTLLNISFAPPSCLPEFGFAILTGNSYGNAIGKISPDRTTPIFLQVDGISIKTPNPYLVKYDNGIEVIFHESQQFLNYIFSGSEAIIQIVPETPRFEFPLAGARAAVSKANELCSSAR